MAGVVDRERAGADQVCHAEPHLQTEGESLPAPLHGLGEGLVEQLWSNGCHSHVCVCVHLCVCTHVCVRLDDEYDSLIVCKIGVCVCVFVGREGLDEV